MAECWHSIGPYVDAVGPAFGRKSVLQVNPHALNFGHQLTAVSFMWSVGMAYMAIYDLETKLVYSFSVLFFFYELFVFLS